MNISLSAFTSAAERMTDMNRADRTLKLDGEKVKDVGHFTWSSTNRATMLAFRDSLRAEFGVETAKVALSVIGADYVEGRKPLTAYTVRQVVDAAQKDVARKEQLAEFISGFRMDGTPIARDKPGNPAPSLDGLMDDCLSQFPSRHLSDAERNEIKHLIAGELMKEPFPPGGVRIFSGTLVNKTKAFAQYLVCPQYEGSQADKFRVFEATNKAGLTMFALQHLPRMRELQADGPLTTATIWNACFGKDLPEQLAGADDTAFANAFAEQKDRTLREYTESLTTIRKGGGIPWEAPVDNAMGFLTQGYNMPLETLKEARDGKKIEGVLIAANIGQNLEPINVRLGRALTEISGLQTRTFSGAPINISVTRDGREVSSFSINKESMPPQAGGGLFKIVQDEDENETVGTPDYRPTHPNASQIAKTWHKAEDALAALDADAPLPDIQKCAVVDAMSQNFNFVLRRLASAAGMSHDPGNASYSMRLERQENGDVLVHHVMHRRAGEGAPFEPHAGVTFRIHPDGNLDGEAPYFFDNTPLGSAPQ